ncbi:MAG: TonB-dependent receptor [Bacteroidota bacterium]
MNAITYITLIFLLLTSSLYGQSGVISGKILSHDQPVPYANVVLKEIKKGGNTDENGQFQLREIPLGEYELTISSIGYLEHTQRILITNSQPINLGSIALREDVFGLEDVVITGTMRETSVSQSPIKVNVISNRFLQQNTSPINLVEGISLINGIEEVVECGVCGTNSLRINGLEGPYTAVLIDGTPMFGNLASVYGLNGIPTSMIDRIEVIKGPNSTLYGSEAVAGVINIITQSPEHQPIVSMDIKGSSLGEMYGNIGFAPQIGQWNGFIGVDGGRANRFIDEIEDGFGDLVNLDRLSVFTKWSKKRPHGKRSFIAGKYYYEDRRNGVEEFLKDQAYRHLRGDDQIYGESIHTRRVEVFGTHEFQTRELLKLDFSFSKHDQNSFYGSDFYEAQQQIGYTNLIWDKTIQKHQLIMGGTIRYQTYDDNTVATEKYDGSAIQNTPNNQFIPGLFVQDEWRIGPSLSLLAGSRLDYYSAHGLIYAPRLNLKYKPSDWTTLRANLGTGFRVVNLFTEDHAFVSGQRNIEILEDLAPERSYNAALNLNHVYTLGDGQGMVDIDAFYTHFLNKIIPDYDTPGKIIYANTDGHAISRGISVSIAHSFSFPLSVTLGGTIQRVTETELLEDGQSSTHPIQFAPDFSSTGTLNYEWKRAKLNLAWSFTLTGPMELPKVYDLDATGQMMDHPRPTRSESWMRHNLQLSRDFSDLGISLYGGVENLFDYRQPISPLVGINDPSASPGFSDFFDTVYTYAPLTGRNVYLGVQWNVGRK